MKKLFTATSIKIFLVLIACSFYFSSMAGENTPSASSLSSSINLSSGWVWVSIAVAFSLLVYLFKKKDSGYHPRERFHKSKDVFDVE